MRRIGKAGGYSSVSTVLRSTETSHGKNSMLLWWLVMHGARVGKEKKSYFIAISPGMELYTDACSDLYAIVVACNAWGPCWQGQKLPFHCDNETIVLIWKRGSKEIMTLLRAAYWVAGHFQITHIRDCDNIIADSLSHSQMPTSCSNCTAISHTHSCQVNASLA